MNRKFTLLCILVVVLQFFWILGDCYHWWMVMVGCSWSHGFPRESHFVEKLQKSIETVSEDRRMPSSPLLADVILSPLLFPIFVVCLIFVLTLQQTWTNHLLFPLGPFSFDTTGQLQEGALLLAIRTAARDQSDLSRSRLKWNEDSPLSLFFNGRLLVKGSFPSKRHFLPFQVIEACFLSTILTTRFQLVVSVGCLDSQWISPKGLVLGGCDRHALVDQLGWGKIKHEIWRQSIWYKLPGKTEFGLFLAVLGGNFWEHFLVVHRKGPSIFFVFF